MDLQEYSIKDLLLTAIKSEEDNYQLYSTLNYRVGDEALASKLDFLSNEEVKHKTMLEQMFSKHYPDEKVEVNDIATDVPLPMIEIAPGYYPVGDILSQVMEAELVTADFYSSWKDIYPDEDELKVLLDNLSGWEMSHYKLVKQLKESIKKNKMEKIQWP